MEKRVIITVVAILGGIAALLLVILLPLSFSYIEYNEVCFNLKNKKSIEGKNYVNLIYLKVCIC
jgi:hypothetical protein